MKVKLRSFLDFSTARFVEDALRAIPTSFQCVKDLKAALLQQEMRQNQGNAIADPSRFQAASEISRSCEVEAILIPARVQSTEKAFHPFSPIARANARH